MTRILSVLGWIGTAMVFAAFAVTMLGLVGTFDLTPQMDTYRWYGAIGGLALVVLYTLGQWREIAAAFGNRNTRYGTLAGVSVLVALGILVAVNYVSVRQNWRKDLTSNQQFSLSEQTTKLLSELKKPVTFTVFDKPQGFERFRTRLTEYQYKSRQVTVEYVDADRSPVKTREFDVETYGTVVIEYEGRRERVTTEAEQDLTNGLIKVLNPTKKKVYFLGGHGEKDPASSDQRTGYNAIAEALKRDNFEFGTLVLAQTNEIPADATVIVVAGPKTDLLEQELSLLRDYLVKSKAMLVLLDPPDFKDAVPMPRLEGLLTEWGITPTPSVVVDLSGQTSSPFAPIAAPPYPQHAITDRFELVTMFPLARAIVPASGAPPNRTAQPFLQTAARSWAETTFSQLEDPKTLAQEPSKGDTPGPVSIGAAVSVRSETPAPGGSAPTAGAEDAQRPETRLAAIGDSDFASNAYLGVEGNRDLFMNAVNWLAQQENLIAIRPREPADRRLTMTAGQITALGLFSVFGIPLMVLGAGIWTWSRRRKG
jgi:ABC-type uncharacterized transport system involved in gliding motility auxiliary subunit